LQGYKNLPVNASYASLAIVLLVPLFAVLIRRKWKDGGLVLAALASFGVAWFCRLIDGSGLADLPMGTHWLWHIFGAITTELTIQFIYRVELDDHPARRASK
jgi:hypothetical protein